LRLQTNVDRAALDEPLGALDFLTRQKMRIDLVRIWQSEKKTILAKIRRWPEPNFLKDLPSP